MADKVTPIKEFYVDSLIGTHFYAGNVHIVLGTSLCDHKALTPVVLHKPNICIVMPVATVEAVVNYLNTFVKEVTAPVIPPQPELRTLN